jgi:hypothetical protein
MHGHVRPPQRLTDPPKREKVYCKECLHIRWSGRTLFTETNIYECKHPNNIKDLGGCWYKPATITSCKRKPKKINKKNNCLWYEKKLQGGGKKLL